MTCPSPSICKGSGSDHALIGWRAKKHAKRIDLERRDYDPLDFWEPIRFHKDSSLILDPDEFYILMTKEAIAVPPDFAAEMLPYDTRAGEFRVHYAGFFDPGFGWDASTRRAGSSRGVLEVRSHEVPFLLEHGQTVGWLHYERMAERPDTLYGSDIALELSGTAAAAGEAVQADRDRLRSPLAQRGWNARISSATCVPPLTRCSARAGM